MDKSEIFDILNLHLDDPDQEIQHTALQLIQVSIYFLHTMCGLCVSVVCKSKRVICAFQYPIIAFPLKI